MVQRKKANANPTKAFFVRMITKDISLEDCILDLIDNSVDGALESSGAGPMTLSSGVDLSPYKISLNVTPSRFEIVDNCGGITLDEAADYAFTFGRSEDVEYEKFSIGVYGIGMKRAVFKLGSNIEISSTYKKANNRRESFKVPIKVDEWLSTGDSENWDFDIEDADHLAKPGVKIVVTRLLESASDAFSSKIFVRELMRTIARDYTLHLHRGLTIEVNGKTLKGWDIQMMQGGQVAPMRTEYFEGENGEKITIEILAGMAAPPTDTDDVGGRSDIARRSGWYVACNGRIVVAASQDSATGWGKEGWPRWHPQFSGFIGMVLFSAENAQQLPMSTTKRGIDQAAGVYRRALPKMKEVTKEWTAYTGARKSHPEQTKAAESDLKSRVIFEVEPRDEVALPKFNPKQRKRQANIAYSMPVEKVRALAKGLGNINLSYREVGLQSFEYASKELVGDE